MKKLLLLLTLTLIPAAHAQFGLGASITASHITDVGSGVAPDTWIYGPTINFQHEHGKVVKFGFDFRASFLDGNGVRCNSGVIGPRLAVAPPKTHLKLYAALMLGAVTIRPATGRLSTGHLEYAFSVGLDHPLSRHLSWRVLDYEHENVAFDKEDERNNLSTGLLVHF